MAYNREHVEEFVCEDCQVTHAGTPTQHSSGGHEFEPPASCGACGGTEFVPTEDWIHYHE